MPITALDILKALQEVLAAGKKFASREQGKHFYEPANLPRLLHGYMAQRSLTTRAMAQALGMGHSSVSRILNGSDISENMLLRLRVGMEELSRGEAIYPGDWRSTQKESVQEAIAVVTEKLIFLRDAVVKSNSLNAADAPIDPLQLAQLVALLNSTLSALQAPFVEAHQASGIFRWLGNVAKKGAEKGLETKIADAFKAAVAAGKHLVDVLMGSGGPPDLGGIG